MDVTSRFASDEAALKMAVLILRAFFGKHPLLSKRILRYYVL